MIKSAGTAASVIAKEDKFIHLKLPSGAVQRFFKDCWATVGQLGNINFKDEIIGSAGRKRLMGVRPTGSRYSSKSLVVIHMVEEKEDRERECIQKLLGENQLEEQELEIKINGVSH